MLGRTPWPCSRWSHTPPPSSLPARLHLGIVLSPELHQPDRFVDSRCCVWDTNAGAKTIQPQDPETKLRLMAGGFGCDHCQRSVSKVSEPQVSSRMSRPWQLLWLAATHAMIAAPDSSTRLDTAYDQFIPIAKGPAHHCWPRLML